MIPGTIHPMTKEIEGVIQENPLLGIDTFLIPSPYVGDEQVEKDLDHSFVWFHEGEILGYLLVYANPSATAFLVYKLVTSPFVRGDGIGTALLAHMTSIISTSAVVYLYVWEKQMHSLEFFLKRGFAMGETLVYRNLVFRHLLGNAGGINQTLSRGVTTPMVTSEEIGRTRHDARKTIRFLSHMVDMLSLENCGRIIEDVNRETTSLVNTLNAFRDSVSREHEVNITELILERIVPYVGSSVVPCELRIKLQKTNVVVLGNYVNISRALVNITANSLEAIQAAERSDGILEIKIGEERGIPYIRFRDNGIGMTVDQLQLTSQGIPSFVGTSTKTRKTGEGLGTLQIYSTFGRENVVVAGQPRRGCTWRITFRKPMRQSNPWLSRLEERFDQFSRLQDLGLDRIPEGAPVEAARDYIWQTRKIEIFLFDLILHFSTHQNIRTIFRFIFAWLMNGITRETLEEEIGVLRVDREQIRQWLMETVLILRERWQEADQYKLSSERDSAVLKEARFKSYGQAIENIIIFTLNPETRKFFATDRKLAEHLDFAPYLDAPREALVRGELNGDVNDLSRPILLGVWSISSHKDLNAKLQLIQDGARALLSLGVDGEKRLGFYQTTTVTHRREIDSDATTTVEAFAQLTAEQLQKYTREADDELQGYLSGQD